MLARGAALALAAVTAFSFLGSTTWLGEITTHFRPHLAAAAIAVLALAGLRRSWLGGALALACLATNIVPLWPYLAAAAPPAPAGEPFRVLTLNLHRDHADYEAVAALIERERPDLVALTEIGAGTEALADRLRPLLPTMVWEERRGSFDVVLLTRWRASDYRVDRRFSPDFPVSRVTLCERRCLNLVAVHAARPLDAHGVWRAGQFEIAAQFAAGEGATVLLGDLNCTPWSPAFAALLAVGRLRDSGLGRGLHATWLSTLPFVGLPIDHVLVGAAIGVRDRRIGPDVGSDHFPVIADLAVAAE